MQPFLYKIASEIYTRHGKDLSQIHLVVPGKRAGLFLKKHLFQLAQTPLIAPKIFILPEWLQMISGQRSIQGFEASIQLYKAYITVVDEPEKFSSFIKWSGQLLNDFNDVDQHLIEATSLYKNIRDIKDIDAWSLHQDPLSEDQKKFLVFWEDLIRIYQQFSLNSENEKKFSYAQLTKKLALQGDLVSDAKHTYFIGLSNFTPAEEKIIARFKKKHADTEIHWDVDPYYVQNPSHEAGHFFREKIKSGQTLAMEDCLSKEERHVHEYKTNTSLGSAAIIGEMVSAMSLEDREKTALIMTDVQMLQPLITHIQEDVDINVALGWNIKNTGIYQLFTSYISFCIKTQSQKRIYHKDLVKWIEQPIIRPFTEPWRQSFIKELIQRKSPYFSINQIQQWMTEDCKWKGLQPHLQLLDIAEASFQQILDNLKILNQWVLEQDELDPLSKECAWQWEEKMEIVHRYIQENTFLQDVESLDVLIQHVIAKDNITLEGEPLHGLQILGMIETRALDFDHVIFVNATEDSMPGQSHMQSLIPFELRKAFGLPMPGDRESSYAYNFYRLLHRAKKISFFYPSTTSDFRSVEKTRYIQQLEWEWKDYNKTIHWHKKQLSLPASPALSFEECVQANALSAQQLRTKLENGISPSAINKYLQCPLEFYYRYVLGLGEINEMEEQMDAATIGSNVHTVLENWHFPKINQTLSLSDIQQWRNQLEEALTAVFLHDNPNGSIEGYNLLAFEAAKKMIERVLDYDESLIKEGLAPYIIATEKDLNLGLTLPNGLPVTLLGKVDRIHKSGNMIVILDYKTGKAEKKDLTLPDGDLINLYNGKKSKLLQIMMYGYLAHMKEEWSYDQMAVGLFPLAKPEAKPLFIEDRDTLFSADVMKNFERGLLQLLQDIEDRIEFRHNEESQYCQFCREAGN